MLDGGVIKTFEVHRSRWGLVTMEANPELSIRGQSSKSAVKHQYEVEVFIEVPLFLSCQAPAGLANGVVMKDIRHPVCALARL